MGTEPALRMENRKDSKALSVTQKRAKSPEELGRDGLKSYSLIKRERKKNEKILVTYSDP